jgi:hypothetical protein
MNILQTIDKFIKSNPSKEYICMLSKEAQDELDKEFLGFAVGTSAMMSNGGHPAPIVMTIRIRTSNVRIITGPLNCIGPITAFELITDSSPAS